MDGQLPRDQAGAWQLISVNKNRQCSADISVFAAKTADTCLRAHICLPSFPCMKRDPGMCRTMDLPGYV